MSNNTPQQPSCRHEYDPNSLSVSQAREHISRLISPVVDQEKVSLTRALGRILACDVISPVNVPPHANSAMDGYALYSSDLPQQGETILTLVGSVFAGHPFQGKLLPSQCLRIMTGASMPEGTDTVIMQEEVQVNGTDVTFHSGHRAGENVRQAGEDIRVQQTVLQQGRSLKPADLGLLASLGIGSVSVVRPLRVTFFSTGDELRAVEESLQPGQIYDSNRYLLHGLLQQLDVEITDLGIIPDQPEAIRQAFLQASTADVLITTGGVSVGDADYVKQILQELGEVDFWKIAMKPGRPLAFGRLGKTLFFGLPGNPVSAMVTFEQFLRPAIRQLRGESQIEPMRLKLRCLSNLKKGVGRVEFQRGILVQENGELCVKSTGPQGSHILTSMSQANCYIILDADNQGVKAGTEVTVELF